MPPLFSLPSLLFFFIFLFFYFSTITKVGSEFLKGVPWCIISRLLIPFYLYSVLFSDTVISLYDVIPWRSLSHYHLLYEDPDDLTPLIYATRATLVYP
jgi:hypothetical protein